MEEIKNFDSISQLRPETQGLPNEKEPHNDEATNTYHDPDENSGLKRLREEEGLTRATSPHLRKTDLTLAFTDKLESLAPLLKHSKFQNVLERNVLPIIIKHVAPYDISLAKAYVDKLKYFEYLEASIELSKHQDPENAQKTLNEIKEKYSDFNGDLIRIYREEIRRGLKGADETLFIMREKKGATNLYYLAKILFKLQKEGFEELIKKAHHEVTNRMRDRDQISLLMCFQLSLLMCLEIEVEAKNPLAFETLQLLRENTAEIWQNALDSKTDVDGTASRNYIVAWTRILEVEAKNEYLAAELEKDLEFCLSTIKSLKLEFPDHDYELELIIGAFVTHYPDQALKILELIDDNVFRHNALSYLIKKGHPAEEMLIKELIKNAEDQDFGWKMIKLTTVSERLAERQGIEKALPFLVTIKSQLHLINNDENLEEVLSKVLKIELKYQLPSAKETLGKLHQVVEKLGEDASFKAIARIFDAELTMLIAPR